MTKTTLRVLTLLAMLLTALPAHAQEQHGDVQELDLRAREFIFVEGSLPWVPTSNTIATKLPLSLSRTPSNVGLVTSALFDQQYGQVLGDALRNVSNVNVQPGFGVHDYFVIRGFDSLSSGLVLTDGAPEPEATFYQLYNVELVEVLKGPGGFLYGSNPLAGTVNLVRKQPLAATGLRAGAASGSFSTFEATIDAYAGRPDGPVFGRFNALVRDAGSYRDAKDSQVLGLNPAVTWNPAAGHTLNANLEYLQSNYRPEAGIPLFFGEVPEVDRGTDYNFPGDRSDQDVFRLQLDYQGEVADGVRIRNKFYVRSLDWLSDGTLINGAFPDFVDGLPTGGVSVARTLIQLDDRQTFVGNQLEAIVSFDTGTVRHDLLAGVEIARLADDFDLGVAILPSIDLFNPIESGFPPFSLPDQAVAGAPRSTVVAPYVIDQIGVSEHVQLLAGARLDSVDFDDPLTFRSRDDTELSPMLGAVWMPDTDVSLYANFSRSFAPPSPRVFGQLEPEKSEQVELGAKLRLLGDRLRATAAVYRLERDNIAIPDDNGFTQQAGNQRSRGFELELAAEPGDGLRAVASYAYNDAELTRFAEQVLAFTGFGIVPVTVDRSGNRPAFAPEHLLDLWASKTLRSGVGIGIGARYLGNQFIAEDNAFSIPDALIVSGSVSYDWSDYRLSLNIRNLTGSEYLVRGFGSQSITPGTPAAVYVRFAYRR